MAAFTRLAKPDEPLKPGAKRDVPFQAGDTTHVLETWEEDDDRRVARLSIVLLGKMSKRPGKILVKAEQVEYDGYHCKWEQHTEGEAYCSSPDEALDTLSNLLAEYAANPITRGRKLSSGGESDKTRGLRAVGLERYRTALLRSPYFYGRR